MAVSLYIYLKLATMIDRLLTEILTPSIGLSVSTWIYRRTYEDIFTIMIDRAPNRNLNSISWPYTSHTDVHTST